MWIQFYPRGKYLILHAQPDGGEPLSFWLHMNWDVCYMLSVTYFSRVNSTLRNSGIESFPLVFKLHITVCPLSINHMCSGRMWCKIYSFKHTTFALCPPGPDPHHILLLVSDTVFRLFFFFKSSLLHYFQDCIKICPHHYLKQFLIVQQTNLRTIMSHDLLDPVITTPFRSLGSFVRLPEHFYREKVKSFSSNANGEIKLRHPCDKHCIFVSQFSS